VHTNDRINLGAMAELVSGAKGAAQTTEELKTAEAIHQQWNNTVTYSY